jgi:hypothetical protein
MDVHDLDSCAQHVQHGPSAAHYSGSGQSCVHAQPCMSEQLCMQGLGVSACFLLECCYLIYMHVLPLLPGSLSKRLLEPDCQQHSTAATA